MVFYVVTFVVETKDNILQKISYTRSSTIVNAPNEDRVFQILLALNYKPDEIISIREKPDNIPITYAMIQSNHMVDFGNRNDLLWNDT